jgi:O-succinylbenzoic acid--CoA ligase
LALPLDTDGWFHTGDLGAWDENGYLRVLGRQDNLFVSGGENIQPEEIEEVLSALPGVEVAVVVPVDDPEFGQRPVAFIKTEGDEPGDLTPKLREFLPGFKVPTTFHPWPENAQRGMKLDRNALRERARQLLDQW